MKGKEIRSCATCEYVKRMMIQQPCKSCGEEKYEHHPLWEERKEKTETSWDDIFVFT